MSRQHWVYALLVLVLAAAVVAALGVGATRTSFADVAAAIGNPTGWQRLVLLELRAPRVACAALAGAALATAGCALQGLFRNPLADPSILGVTATASLGAVLALVSGAAQRVSWAVPAAACTGALLGTGVLFGFASRARSASGLLLLGVALGQIAGAATSLVLALSLADYAVAAQILRWLLGGFDARTWTHVAWGVGPTLVGISAVLLAAPGLDALLLGRLGAEGVGIDTRRLMLRLVVTASLLAGGSVALGGSVGFIGLLVPHGMRRLVGARHAPLIAASALGGSALLVLCDLAARTALRPAELPLGVVTALVGAPVFVHVLLSNDEGHR